MRVIFATAGLVAALGAGAASAQCVAAGTPGATIVTCPGAIGSVTTQPGGVVTGMIGGQPFVGREASPGFVTGILGGTSVSIGTSLVPDAPALPPPTMGSTPPVVLPPPPAPFLPDTPVLRPFAGDSASRAATRRRNDYLRALRDAEAARMQAP